VNRRVLIVAFLILVPLLASCTAAPAAARQVSRTLIVKLGDRPFTLHIPASYDRARPAPLVLLLHGYRSTGSQQESYMRFTAESDKHGFLYAYPNGLVDPKHYRYWNATDACCNLYHSTVDDSTYLSDVIRTVERSYTVDTRRIYLVGHSNGAFMAFRMACDHADQIAAIAALNGAMWADASRCKSSGPVSILDIRSTADHTIAYKGGTTPTGRYPSATTTDADWVRFDHCAATLANAPAIDIVRNLQGAETRVTRYSTGCAGGSTVETWTIRGGPHIPKLGSSFASSVMGFLLSQVKPIV
jgi:polyhydroxybutyrate depolymerase